MRPKFVLFDIDGTLVSMHKSFMPRVIAELVKRLGREEPLIADGSFAGRTDRDIFSRLLQKNGLHENAFDSIRDTYLQVLEELSSSKQLMALSGARDAIEYSGQQGHGLGLLTGNFERAAYTKLNRVGLDHFFETGAFGGEHHDRNSLPEIAYEKGKALLGNDLQPADLIIIGDTPNDIACAKHFGCMSVAVATGPYTASQLRENKPDFILSSLNDPARWMPALWE